MSQEEGDVEVMEDVELSSDEEEDNDDEVSLIVLKRPDLIKRVVQDVEVKWSKTTSLWESTAKFQFIFIVSSEPC